MPQSPPAMAAARARYGLTSAPGMRLSTRRPAPWPDRPEPAGPVVLAPHHGGGRPRVGHVPAVGVDVGGEAPGQLAGGEELAGQELLPHGGQAGRGVVAVGRCHQRRAGGASHRLVWMWHDEPALSIDHLAMKVAARPKPGGDLLDPVLEHQVPVGHLEGPAVGDVDLVLADAGLALGELDGDARPRPSGCGCRR